MSIKSQLSSRRKQDLFKLAFLCGALGLFPLVIAVTPGFFLPTLLAFVMALLFSPFVVWLERRDLSRGASIGILFGSLAFIILTVSFWLGRTIAAEWGNLKAMAPSYFEMIMSQMTTFETRLKAQYPMLQSVEMVESFKKIGHQSGAWLLEHGAGLAGDFFQCLIFTPLLAIVMLQSGPAIRRALLGLVPNRLFEPSFMVTTQVTNAFSDYIQAKLLEAFLVGLICYVGFVLVGAPYAFGLALFAGLTNILPYIGPFLGVVPCVLVTAFDPANAAFFWPVMVVYWLAQLIDNALIFPVMVARLVNLHPLVVILAVMIGQNYYGLIGMLISVPIVTALKIVIAEIHATIYAS